MKSNRIIFFDFDGVIVDSFRPAFEAQKMVRAENKFSEEDYRKDFEGNIYEQPGNGADEFDVDLFFKIYIPKLLALPVIDGIREALMELSGDYKLVIVSSTISKPIRDWLLLQNINQYFAEIMGGDVHKSKTEKIKMTFEKYGVEASDCVFITDTLGDMREAGKTGVRALAVTYGCHSEATLLKGGPAGFIRKPQDITTEVEKYWDKFGDVDK